MRQTPAKRTLSLPHVLLGITGGIAAYKAAELVRLLVKQGMTVQVAMTEAACRFITPVTMQALSGRPVLLDQWDAADNGMAHIDKGRAADAILIAPASADFIAKLALGLANDLLSTLCLARDCPLLVAPAMNRQMWSHAATRRNIAQLKRDGVAILGPDCGDLACGEEGEGRMLEPQALMQALQALGGGGSHGALAGVKILMTAGPTYEAIDAVRGITNRSSGKMGYAVAQAALGMGAEVTLVSGPVALEKLQGAETVDVTSAEEMFDAVKQRVARADIFIGVAAVADYRVAHPSRQKIKKSADTLMLELVPNPDILAYVANLKKPPFCVGFAAESEELEKHAKAKRRAKNVPLLVANLAQETIGADEAGLVLFDDAGKHVFPHMAKPAAARKLLEHVAKLYRSEKK